jgi:2-oxoglutarate ferredoxin oxidoreductase subunit beta
VDLNIVLMNNKIYGLTKGQFSPTTERGFVTKSSPYGTVEDPFNPAELTFGARGTFFARSIDVDLQNTTDILEASAKHKGTSVTEILVNCVIYNTDNHAQLSNKAFRADHTIFLRHGEKMLFGQENEKGLVLDGLKLKVVTIGQDGYTIDDILVHDAKEKDITLHSLLSMMEGDLPLALGVIRNVEALVYDEAIYQQIEDVKAQKPARTLQEMLISGESWEIK